MIHQLLFGCPVCRQRTRHLVFCRYRSAPLDVPPIIWPVAATVLFWGVVGYSIAGWLGVGAAVMAVALVVLMCAGFADASRNRPSGTPREEVVGELFVGGCALIGSFMGVPQRCAEPPDSPWHDVENDPSAHAYVGEEAA